MPTLRVVLEKLPHGDLKRMADAAELNGIDRRSAAPIVAALEGLGPSHVRVLLADLPRAVLKDACRALSIDDSGREKLLLVDRLIPLSEGLLAPVHRSTTPAVTSTPKESMARRTKKQNNGNGASLGFEATLWLAADKLRNNLAASEPPRTSPREAATPAQDLD